MDLIRDIYIVVLSILFLLTPSIVLFILTLRSKGGIKVVSGVFSFIIMALFILVLNRDNIISYSNNTEFIGVYSGNTPDRQFTLYLKDDQSFEIMENKSRYSIMAGQWKYEYYNGGDYEKLSLLINGNEVDMKLDQKRNIHIYNFNLYKKESVVFQKN